MKTLRAFVVLLVVALLGGCAGLQGRDAPRVSVVGLEPLPGQGLELRMLVKLRVTNPNDTAIDYDGVALDMDVQGKAFATGVSDARGTVPRFGEVVLSVPVTISALAVLRQAAGMAQGAPDKVVYGFSGKLAGPQWRSVHFNSEGEFTLPAGLIKELR